MRTSAIARLIVMGGLAFFLLVPLIWVWTIVAERAARRNEAVRDVSATWGGPQTIAGPVLTVPYTTVWTDASGRQQRGTGRAHFLPRQLRVDGTLDARTRTRGIFHVIVYHGTLKMDGRFARPDMSWIRPAPDSIDWQGATVSVGVSDPKGLSERVALRFAGQETPFTGGVADVGLFASGIHARLGSSSAQLQEAAELPFALALAVNGTREIRFLGNADETTVDLTAGWPHPGFGGSPLPEHRRTEGGFSARWHAPDFGRPYAARWASGDVSRDHLLAAAQESAFGVSLVQPVDIYHQAERAVKYAVLFIVLTFLVFFVWEIFSTALLHPMQYAFVGFGLFMFYLLLVSLSEHAGFDTAYLTSSIVTTALIAGYARAVLGGRARGASVLVALAALYGFLYLLLRLEDYALLAGSVGLFVVLAVVMFLTRRMDWYALRLGSRQREA